MKTKNLTNCWPVGLLLIAGSAHADLSPYTITASETLEHESNVSHTTVARPDWYSTTMLRGGVDQELGRERLQASAAVNFDRYKKSKLNNNGYDAQAEFDWATVGDLSGALGANSSRKLYVYGLDGDRVDSERNLQTTNHAFARAQLGGVTRWTLFTGVDGSQRKYTSSAFKPDEVKQWSAHGGTRYATSPDLNFGLVGTYTKGQYPHAVGGSQDFSIKTFDATSSWQASGNSSLDLRAGWTIESNDNQGQRHYWNGDAKWKWQAGGRTNFTFEFERDTDTDTSVGAGGTASSDVTGHSLNTTGRFNASYELTAKITLVGIAQYTQRRYESGTLPTQPNQPQSNAAGSNRTTQYSIAAHYLPVPNADLSCSFAHEVRRADAQIVLSTPEYTANTALCSAQIMFR